MTVILVKTGRLEDAVKIGEVLLKSINFIHIDEELFRESWKLLKSREKKILVLRIVVF